VSKRVSPAERLRAEIDEVFAGGEDLSRAIERVAQWHRQVVCLGVVLPGLVVVAIATRYKGYRYPIEVIGHAVWLYHRFALSLRDVDELMLARGVAVTYETIRSWCAKFGPDYFRGGTFGCWFKARL
jgi:hypothetical protein